eukprot:Nk52_evm1s1082 gene=Nk52_evmTU1s1082
MIVAVLNNVEDEVLEIISTTKYALGGGDFDKFRKWFIKKFSVKAHRVQAAVEVQQFNPIGISLRDAHMQFTILLRRAGKELSQRRAR